MAKSIGIFLFLFLSCFSAFGTIKVDTTIGLTAPGSVCGHYQDLAHYLCDDLQGDQAKANAIFNWITHNIKYDIKGMRDINRDPDKIIGNALKRRKAICEGYSMLFTEMCREVGLKAVNIEGYFKDWMSDNGDKLYMPRHMWSAVLIDGNWQLVEPTWAAGGLLRSPSFSRKVLNYVTRRNPNYAKKVKFKYEYKPEYFAQDPEIFRLKHLPSDPMWQLTDTLMPREVFEIGDSAVRQFNLVSKPAQNNEELLRAAQLEEKQKTFEMADRAYKYNERYPAILGLKHVLRADAEIKRAFYDTTVQAGRLLLIDAQNALKQSQGYIADQKKVFPQQYSDLKKKNKVKNQQAKQYTRLVKADNKRNIAQFKKYVKSANSGSGRLKKNYADIRKRRSQIHGSLDNIESAGIQKKNSAPELKELNDSVDARTARIATLQTELLQGYDKIKMAQAVNTARLDSMKNSWNLADSYFVRETISRLTMHDNYDEEVIQCSAMFKKLKMGQTDTFQKYYFANCDTIVNLFVSRHKLRRQMLDMYQKNVRSLQQYKKWNSNDPGLTARYNSLINEYTASLDEYNEDLKANLSFFKGNKKLFAYLGKQNQKEIKLAAYMDKAEDMRKMLEAQSIEARRRLDLRENQKQKVVIEKAREKLKEVNEKLN